jgi:DnaK suppressor protein
MSTDNQTGHETPGTAIEHFALLDRLRRERRAELEARLGDLRSSPSQDDPVHVNGIEDLFASASSADVSVVTAEILSRTLRSIEYALERLHGGRYGVCDDCGAAISQARLQAVPFAARCRNCQEITDAGGAALAA